MTILQTRIASKLAIGALCAFTSAAHAQEQVYPEVTFPVDTMLEERMRPIPGANSMPYTNILTFPRSIEACFENTRDIGQIVKMEYYLEASPIDLGILPASSFTDNQMRREAFVTSYGSDLSASIKQIWEAAMNVYDGPVTGIPHRVPEFTEPFKYVLAQAFEDFEEQTGITVDISIARIYPGPVCAKA